MKTTFSLISFAFFILHPQPSLSISPKTSANCADQELVFSLLNKIIRSEFPRRQINILYHGESPLNSPSRPCKDMEQVVQDEEGQPPMRSAVTVSSNIFKEEQLLRQKRQKDDSFVGENFHFHQLSHWTEVNLVFLYSLDNLDAMVSSLVFKRINSYNFLLEQENLVEDLSRPNLLSLPAMNRLKFKINLIWDSVESKELVAESTCFYCDEGYPEVVQVWRATQRQLAAGPVGFPLAIPSRSDLFKDYTRDFNGKTLRVSMSLGIPTMMNFKVLKNGRMVATSGFQTSLFHLVRRKLNFSYKLKLEPVFGLEGPNGTYTGMVGAVQTGSSDLGMGAAATFGRHRVVHYLTPNTFHIVTFITRSSILLPEWQTVFRAFTRPLWFTLLLVTTFVMLPVYVTVGVLGRSGSSGDLPLGAIIFNGVSFIFRPLMDQHRVLSSNSSIRTLNVFWLFSVLVICAEFRSNLISLFLQPPMESLPTTFTQLANSDYAIYTHYAGGSLEDIVRGTHTKTFDKINQKMILEESIQKCLKVTMTQKAACISYEDDAIIEGERYFSDPYGHSFIHRAPFAAFNFFASIILPKEALYIDAMETTVGQIVDMGISKRFHDEQHHWTKRKGMSLARKRRNKLPIFYDSHHHFAKLNLSHFSAAFTVLFLGVLAAMITWVFEQKDTDNFKQMWSSVLDYLRKISPSSYFKLVGGPLKIPLKIPLKKSRIQPVLMEQIPEGGGSDTGTKLIVAAKSAAVETSEWEARELVSD